MRITSNVLGHNYDDEDMVFFRNYVQAAYYIEWGARLYDLFTDSKHKLVFVFSKDDHKRLIDRWMKQKDEHMEQSRA